jgi:hypothetical protein
MFSSLKSPKCLLKSRTMMRMSVVNMAPYAISSSLILVIHDNLINGMLGGYPKNSDDSPNTREREFLTRSNTKLERGETVIPPADCTSPKNLNPFTRALAPPFIGR